MPAAVATIKSTTCKIIRTTLISLTTKARAFEFSMPSTVTYCCCDKCSIFEIWIDQKLFLGSKRLYLKRLYLNTDSFNMCYTHSSLTIFQDIVYILQPLITLILHFFFHICNGLFQILYFVLKPFKCFIII